MRNGIRTNFIFASLLLVLFLMGTRGVTASTPAGDSNPTIYLHARTFTPTPGNDLPASTGQPRHGLIQFYALPGRAELAALQQAQVTLLTYIPNNTWLAVLPPRVARRCGSGTPLAPHSAMRSASINAASTFWPASMHSPRKAWRTSRNTPCTGNEI